MFIGHYGPALAAKPLARQVPLWLLFVSVQWLDFCWSALVLMGVEKARIVPGFTQQARSTSTICPSRTGWSARWCCRSCSARRER